LGDAAEDISEPGLGIDGMEMSAVNSHSLRSDVRIMQYIAIASRLVLLWSAHKGAKVTLP